MNLRDYFGGIDIYLFDQLLKGRFDPSKTLLDAGCGSGRNLVYFLREGYPAFGIDTNAEAIAQVQRLARTLAPHLPANHFQVANLAALSFPDARFDAVVCSAVLHFADDEAHFDQMLTEMWRVLKPGGLFFARLASTIGIEDRVQPMHRRWFALPDGTSRFLVDEAMLLDRTARWNGHLLEPIKTTNVQNRRAMTTWVVRKAA
ncbi:MAG TPA: class I SAM-dependent methyltransferase [Rhodothermales bacterium]|nr:class I SAM-dependent methyltransferase [Rhodothermales bacterium]